MGGRDDGEECEDQGKEKGLGSNHKEEVLLAFYVSFVSRSRLCPLPLSTMSRKLLTRQVCKNNQLSPAEVGRDKAERGGSQQSFFGGANGSFATSDVPEQLS